MPVIASWMNPALEVRESAINGRGIYAVAPLAKDERVAIFGGEILYIDELKRLKEDLRKYPLQIEERFMLWMRDSEVSEDTDYFNHSCDPNCGMQGQIFLVAMRDIAVGEEITFDYCLTLSEWEGSDLSFEMECRCGAAHCRGRVTQRDWRRPELQERYRGYFSHYLEKKIERIKTHQH
jgi:uncharacterized protein